MKHLTDQNYLKNEQYHNGQNLDARIQLHLLFTRGDTNWYGWLMEKIDPKPGLKILEVGCGMGNLWQDHLSSLPQDLQITLTDLSEGMVAQAQQNLGSDPRFHFRPVDVQSLPFGDGFFDRVVANHMLYHVPDIQLGLREIRRVLQKGGKLCASTVGEAHMIEMYQLIWRYLPDFENFNQKACLHFGLENGEAIIKQVFEETQVEIAESWLWITEAQPLMAYMRSSWDAEQLPDEILALMKQDVEAEIKQKGGLKITKSTGVILAS